MQFTSKIYTFSLLTILFFSNCKRNSFEVEKFNPLSNYNTKKNDSTFLITTDLSNSVLYGIEIPTVKQLPNGKFTFEFSIKNNGAPQQFFYKLYYQNESYKWENGDSLDTENFYGSWDVVEMEYKSTPIIEKELAVKDSFRIIGNPRDEKLYYGADPEKTFMNDSLLKGFIKKVNSESDWVESIKQKAIGNKISIEEQTYLEALWSIDNSFQTDSVYNNRYKRNPRMGNYKFLLVVCDGVGLSKIPDDVKSIGKKNEKGNFTNPFTYFLMNEGKNLEGTKVMLAKQQLAVSSSLDLGSGLYVDKLKINSSKINTSAFKPNCNTSETLRRTAHFSQYFHHINKTIEFVNVKEIRDVIAENFTREQYADLISSYGKSKNFIHTYSSVTDCPCKTVTSDNDSKAITIFNPANAPNEFKKEHVGVISRIGFTYGKWCAKIKFPKIMSKDNVWNGLTTAFWLIFQADSKWNMRRICKSDVGYIPKQFPDDEGSVKEARPQVTYSEIDFEILKESKYWTKSAYNNGDNYPKEDASKNNDLTICCTNWDMGCQQPKNYVIGAKKINVDGKEIEFCRWNYFNKLVTSKVSAPHEEVFNDDFYYFEIDWQPQRIIWRIGKDKNNLKEICSMNNEMTSIPNNQMLMVMSQEFHYQEWWPTAPFQQNYTPFPKNDLVGKLLEVEIR
ncbi:MAG: hypothetical protein H0U95_00040 [Bacteroidetes bacterium]|nr:hypothetical protein [Bacteroidota bacterium]